MLRLDGSQVVLPTAEGDTLVLDCLVPGDAATTREPRPQVPFSLRTCLPHTHGPLLLPAALRLWIETGTSTDISFRQQPGVSLVRLTGAGSEVTLELQSPARHSGDPGPSG